MVLNILKIYMILMMILLVVYTVRHYVFTLNRLVHKPKMYYGDIISTPPVKISVIIPMHNEQDVVRFCLDNLIECDYDRDYMEIIPVDDNSTDATAEIVDEYAEKYSFIHPIHRRCEDRGKPAGLNDALKVAKGDVIIVFDADYRPAKDLLKRLANAFLDPEVGAVMGRVIPYNTNKNLLTRLLNMERSGGYQVDQQARYNLGLTPQYGGTVGGFRKDFIMETGGFDTAVLAEDTEITYRFYTAGYKVVYANSAECYEESPETWLQRAKQIRRWSRGHNQVLFRYFGKTITNKKMRPAEKFDGILLLLIYAIPLIILIGQIFSIVLFFSGDMGLFGAAWVLMFLGVYSTFGNFAPFYEISTAMFIDGIEGEVHLLPLVILNFYFYMIYISMGFFDAVWDSITKRNVTWDKTKRFVNKEGGR